MTTIPGVTGTEAKVPEPACFSINEKQQKEECNESNFRKSKKSQKFCRLSRGNRFRFR